MPRTLARNILGILRHLGVDVAGKGAKVSDDIQLTFPLTDFSQPALIPHFGGRIAHVGPAGQLTSIRIQAPPDRAVRITFLQANTASIMECSISETDEGGGYTPIVNPTTNWNGAPLAFPQRGGIPTPRSFGPCFLFDRPSGTPGPQMVGRPPLLEVPPNAFIYFMSQGFAGTVDLSVIFSEPIPTVPVRIAALRSHS
jgi:hypothetical protein